MGGIFETDRNLDHEQVFRNQEIAYDTRTAENTGTLNRGMNRELFDVMSTRKKRVDDRYNTKENNELLQMITSRKLLKDGDWEDYRVPSCKNRPLLPAAKKDRFYRSFIEMAPKKGWIRKKTDK